MSANPVGWADTPAVRELREAAAECGLTIDPLAEREADWGLDEVDLLRLHRAWSAKMRARCGLSDTQPVTTVAVGARQREERAETRERRKAHWAEADTFKNRVLGALSTSPIGAVTPNRVVERLNLPRGATITNRVAAALGYAWKCGEVARRVDKRHGMGPRQGYAYWRVAA